MGLAKQAKTLTKRQAALVISYLGQTRYPDRNRAIFLLSIKAGLRAKEIAALTWAMVTDAEGELGAAIHLQDVASKGKSGRVIPLNAELRAALQLLFNVPKKGDFVIASERSSQTSAPVIVNLFAGWYQALNFTGCSSHTGRRTFITNAARQISGVGGSLRDVQNLAGHAALSTTQLYIECHADAQQRVVALV